MRSLWPRLRLSAFLAVLSLGLAASPALAAPAVTYHTVTLEDSTADCAAWVQLMTGSCASGLMSYNGGGGVAAYSPAITPGASAGYTATVVVTGTIPGWVDTCTGPGTGCTRVYGTYVVPSTVYYLAFENPGSGGSASGVSVSASASLPVLDTIAYPSVDLVSLNASVTGFFNFLAPILWLVGGIAIGGYLLHKALGIMR
jgi:hypothetical protein